MTETTAENQPAAKANARRQRIRRNVEWIVIVLVAVSAALLVKAYLVEAFYIPSGSMEPTLDIGDRVLVNKLSYRLHDVHRGDVVVFERPPGIAGESNIRDFIKRVIALPGDTVESRNDEVYVNGHRLREPYLPASTKTIPAVEKQVVPRGRYWVMGDNRTNSSDSRVFGTITKHSIVGRAFIQVWPIGRIGGV